MTKRPTPAPAPAGTNVVPTRPRNRDQLLSMLESAEGVSIEDMSDRFGWKPHSARAMLTGLRKAGHDVQRSKIGTVTVYKVSA